MSDLVVYVSSPNFPELPSNTTEISELKWFGVDQNNSGGHFIINDEVGHWVFVQARNATEATARLKEITKDSGEDWCPCCGERWLVWLNEDDGHPEPMIYGTPVRLAKGGFSSREEIRMYAQDGRVAYYKIPE